MIKPFGQRIIVQRIFEDERGGIVIPKQYVEKTSLVGKVLAIGPDCVWTAKDDIVNFGQFAGVNMKVDGKYITNECENCIIMNEEDLLGLVGSNASGEFVPAEKMEVEVNAGK